MAHLTNKKTKAAFGLLGEHLKHSQSPWIHQQFNRYAYELWELPPCDLPAFFKAKAFQGLNVTIPYKITVMDYLDDLTPEAQKIGSVNTIVNRAGRLLGANTDYLGFHYLLKQEGLSVTDRHVLVLGSGGASQMVQTYCQEEGAASVTVISRQGPNHYDNLYAHPQTQMLVNATPVGMYPNNTACKVALDYFPQLEAVVDLIYNPLRTRLLERARERDIHAVNGLGMLVAQAFAAMELFMNEKGEPQELDRITQRLERRMQNLVLIGMPGAGKTSMGQRLAQKLQRPFVDLDAKLVECLGQSIPDVFAKYGEAYFRQVEAQLTEEFAKETGQVMATGGGTPLRPSNRLALQQNGFIFYLDRPVEELATAARPLSKDLPALKAMYQNRHQLYQGLADQRLPVVEGEEVMWERLWKAVQNENFSA